MRNIRKTWHMWRFRRANKRADYETAGRHLAAVFNALGYGAESVEIPSRAPLSDRDLRILRCARPGALSQEKGKA